MTEETNVAQENTEQPVQINIGQIIYAILKDQTKVTVPAELVLGPVPENTEVEINYNSDSKQFIFSIKPQVQNESGN